MNPHLIYGARYLWLCMIDTCFFRWHGVRPISWTRMLVFHRCTAPFGGILVSGGTDEERAELAKAQALYPDRHMYLGAGSSYSPWYGERWHHYVKVLVVDSTGAPPPTRYGGGGSYGMAFDQFKQTEWGQKRAPDAMQDTTCDDTCHNSKEQTIKNS